MPQESARATTAHIAGRIAANHLGGGAKIYICHSGWAGQATKSCGQKVATLQQGTY